MKILVTGSAGFMGSHLTDYLINEGHEVWGLDDLSLGNLHNISKKAKERFLKIDLKNKAKVEKTINEIKPQLVYHLAAWAHEGLSQFSPRLIIENNLNAFINLIIPLIKNNVNKIVVCSSMAVYGNQEAPFSEDLRRIPEDVYAVSKTAIEETVEILSKVYGFNYTIIRPHNVYGPRQNLSDPYRNVAAIFINRMLIDKQFYIYGNGRQTRAFSYIDDIIPPLARSGFLDKANGEIINLGPEKSYTINKLSNLVLSAFNRLHNTKYKPIYMHDRPQEVKHAYCTAEKAKVVLGFEDKTSLKDGIVNMVRWARSVGYQKPKYLEELELSNGITPLTWKEKLL